MIRAILCTLAILTCVHTAASAQVGLYLEDRGAPPALFTSLIMDAAGVPVAPPANAGPFVAATSFTGIGASNLPAGCFCLVELRLGGALVGTVGVAAGQEFINVPLSGLPLGNYTIDVVLVCPPAPQGVTTTVAQFQLV